LSIENYLAAMDNFVVSARKYRPTGFGEVVGQEHITTTLKNAIDGNKLAQALLFCGPRGVGKTTCARIVARLINSFEEKAETNSLNIFELDAASNNSVEDIRNLIDQVRYPPQFGKFKVYIIDEVHMLSNAAFNAFLKTLEEPPSYAIFILATTEKHKVIPTILSRCQIFDFNRIQISDIADHLKVIAKHEGVKAEDEALHLIAQKADGALRDALSIFDLMVTYSSGKEITFKDVLSNLHILDYDYYFNVVDALLSQNHSQPLLLLDEVLRKGFDGHNFIVGLSEHLRNLLVSQDARTTQLMEVPESVRKKYAQQAQVSSPSLLLSWLSIANQCDINYKSSKNQRLSVELALMKMAHVQAVIEPGQIPAAPATAPHHCVDCTEGGRSGSPSLLACMDAVRPEPAHDARGGGSTWSRNRPGSPSQPASAALMML
jgi:DNA polymerase-3 subunit gamma/tau